MFAYQSKCQPDNDVEQAVQALAQRYLDWAFWRPPLGRSVTDCTNKGILSIISEFGVFIAY